LGPLAHARTLRQLGRDTFILTDDVCAALIREGVVAKKPTSKRDLAATQAAFEGWRSESGRSLCELRVVLACSV